MHILDSASPGGAVQRVIPPNYIAAQNLKLARRILVTIFLLGLYTNLSIQLGELRLFGAYSLAAGFFLFLLRPPRSNRWYLGIAVLILICAFSVAFGAQIWDRGLRSTAQLVVSIIAATAFARELTYWRRVDLIRLTFWCAVVVVIFAILEAYAGLAVISDFVRGKLYGSDGIFLYSSDDRDLTLHGITRPKVFTQEPSHPAKWVAVMLSAWLLLSNSKNKKKIFLGIFFFAMVAMRSPTLVLSLIVFSYVLFVERKTRSSMRNFTQFAFLTLLVVGLFTVQYWVGLLPFDRAQAFAEGTDASSVIRVLGPAQIAMRELWLHPIAGVGIGAVDAAQDTLLDVYSQFSSIKMERFTLVADSGWGNSFFQFLVFFGVLGSSIFFAWLIWYSRFVFLADGFLCLIFFVVIFNFEGAFVIVRPWSYLFILLCAVYKSRTVR